MPLNRIIITAALLFSAHTASAGGDRQPTITTKASQVTALLEPWNKPDTPGVAIAVTLDGKVALETGVGIANLEYGIPVTSETAFRVASVSKQFTAFSILLLEAEGKLSLDDNVRKHIPELHDYSTPVTLRRMMNHTNGLRGESNLIRAAGWREDDAILNDMTFKLLAQQQELNFAPGDRYQYHNSGFALLAEVVERVSGQRFADYTQRHIFTPLGMTNSQFPQNNEAVIKNAAYSYYKTADGFKKSLLNTDQIGSAGLVTTAHDMSLWARNFEDATVGSPAIFAAMREQGVLNDGTVNIYAMGQEVRPYKGFNTVSHGGRNAAYRSFILRIPEVKFSVSILSNLASFDTADIAYTIADIYLGDHPDFTDDQHEQITFTDAELKSFEGTYELFPAQMLNVKAEGQKLYIQDYGQTAWTEMTYTQGRNFLIVGGGYFSVEFPAPDAAPEKSFKFHFGKHGHFVAPEVKLAPFDADAANLSAYAGDYYSEELGTTYHLIVKDGALVAQHVRQNDITLKPYQPDLFIASQWFITKTQFERGAASEITGFRASGPTAENMLFTKVN